MSGNSITASSPQEPSTPNDPARANPRMARRRWRRRIRRGVMGWELRCRRERHRSKSKSWQRTTSEGIRPWMTAHFSRPLPGLQRETKLPRSSPLGRCGQETNSATDSPIVASRTMLLAHCRVRILRKSPRAPVFQRRCASLGPRYKRSPTGPRNFFPQARPQLRPSTAAFNCGLRCPARDGGPVAAPSTAPASCK